MTGRRTAPGRDAAPVPPGVAPEPVTPDPPAPVRHPLLHQYWADVVFLHWRADPAAVAPLLPPRTRPDTHDGVTWVGLVHFRMRRLGFGPLPGLPWLGSFAETNVRLYSVDDEGRRGVVFRSLDADRMLPVLAARGVAALPYDWSPSTVSGRVAEGEEIAYSCTRRFPGPRGVSARTPGPHRRPAGRARGSSSTSSPRAGRCTPGVRWAPSAGATTTRAGRSTTPSCSNSTRTWSPRPVPRRRRAPRTASSPRPVCPSGSAAGAGSASTGEGHVSPRPRRAPGMRACRVRGTVGRSAPRSPRAPTTGPPGARS